MLEIIGRRRLDFMPTNGDNRIDGLNLYVCYEDDNVTGVATDKIFLPFAKFGEQFDSLTVGTLIEVSYNKYGKIQAVHIAAV